MCHPLKHLNFHESLTGRIATQLWVAFLIYKIEVIQINLKDKIFELRQQNTPWTKIDELLDLTPDHARNLARRDPRYQTIANANPHDKSDEMDKKYYKDDGSITSLIRTNLNAKKIFSKDELLVIHGFDPKEFQIRSITSNEWTMNTTDDVKYNYQSKIVAEPINPNHIDIDKCVNILKQDIKPIHVQSDYIGDTNLVIQLADLHFGVTKFEDTIHKLSKLKSRIEYGYKTIVIEQLGDLFHSSQMKASQTLKGTLLEDVDMVQAVEDAKQFYDVAIQCCMENSDEVIIEHAGGNHSNNMEYMFLIYLETKYPQITVNYHNDSRTVYKLGNVGVMLSHGDTVPLKKLPMLFANEYKMLWAECETSEIHTAHKHNKFTEEEYDGVILRQAPTIKPNDLYEIDNGWTTARKIIQVIEYDEDGEVGSYVI